MNESQNLYFLWRRYTSGDQKSFKQIFETLYPALFSYALRLLKQPDLAENAVSDTFTKIIQYPDKGDIDSPERWFFTIIKNNCISYWRKQNRRNDILTSLFSDDLKFNSYPDAEYILDKSFITSLISTRLNNRDFTIWQLMNEGYDNSEIAKIMEITKKTVGNRKSLIRANLVGILEETENLSTTY